MSIHLFNPLENVTSRRPSSSSRHRCNVDVATVLSNVSSILLLLFLLVAMPQLSGAASLSSCGCQFNHECFPADGDSLRQAVKDFNLGTWTGMLGGVDYGLNISEWCTGLVTDMNRLFYNKQNFDEDISLWNVASVQDMNSMFYYLCCMNGDLSQWDVSNVTEMSYMFYLAKISNRPKPSKALQTSQKPHKTSHYPSE